MTDPCEMAIKNYAKEECLLNHWKSPKIAIKVWVTQGIFQLPSVHDIFFRGQEEKPVRVSPSRT